MTDNNTEIINFVELTQEQQQIYKFNVVMLTDEEKEARLENFFDMDAETDLYKSIIFNKYYNNNIFIKRGFSFSFDNEYINTIINKTIEFIILFYNDINNNNYELYKNYMNDTIKTTNKKKYINYNVFFAFIDILSTFYGSTYKLPEKYNEIVKTGYDIIYKFVIKYAKLNFYDILTKPLTFFNNSYY